MIGQYVTVHGDVISHVNISHVTVEDGGEYTCTAENRAGRSWHSARLNVYGKVKHFRGVLFTAVSCGRLSGGWHYDQSICRHQVGNTFYQSLYSCLITAVCKLPNIFRFDKYSSFTLEMSIESCVCPLVL